MSIVTLDPTSLQTEHICCAISDKKSAGGYAAKKKWLTNQYGHGYRFARLDERGKVFIEYGPGEQTWMPVVAPNWMVLGCFWVSGKFKNHGHGKALLKSRLMVDGVPRLLRRLVSWFNFDATAKTPPAKSGPARRIARARAAPS